MGLAPPPPYTSDQTKKSSSITLFSSKKYAQIIPDCRNPTKKDLYLEIYKKIQTYITIQ